MCRVEMTRVAQRGDGQGWRGGAGRGGATGSGGASTRCSSWANPDHHQVLADVAKGQADSSSAGSIAIAIAIASTVSRKGIARLGGLHARQIVSRHRANDW